MNCLFEYYEDQPKNLAEICNKWLECLTDFGLSY